MHVWGVYASRRARNVRFASVEVACLPCVSFSHGDVFVPGQTAVVCPARRATATSTHRAPFIVNRDGGRTENVKWLPSRVRYLLLKPSSDWRVVGGQLLPARSRVRKTSGCGREEVQQFLLATTVRLLPALLKTTDHLCEVGPARGVLDITAPARLPRAVALSCAQLRSLRSTASAVSELRRALTALQPELHASALTARGGTELRVRVRCLLVRCEDGYTGQSSPL